MKIYDRTVTPLMFTGIHIANSTNCIKNLETSIDLFQLTPKDKSFLDKLQKTIKMKNLMPESKLSDTEFDCWQYMFDRAGNIALNQNKKSILAVKDNKPCGIITYQTKDTKYHIDYICSWPAETGKKVPLAGQTLMKQLFTNFLSEDGAIINLSAILNGPFNPVVKYMNLGFVQTGGENNIVAMRINRDKVIKTMEKLNKNIKTVFTNGKKDVNLTEKLDL